MRGVRLLAAELPALLSTRALADDTVRVEVHAPVVEVVVRDGVSFVRIDRGERDGIHPSTGRLDHNDQVDGSGLVEVGVAQVEEVGPDHAGARVAVDPDRAPADLTDRVTVQLEATVPARLLGQQTFHLARRGVVLTGYRSTEPMFTRRELLDHPEVDVDRRFYAAVRAMLAQVQDQAASLAIAGERPAGASPTPSPPRPPGPPPRPSTPAPPRSPAR